MHCNTCGSLNIDTLERGIVEKLIESLEAPMPQNREVNNELLRMVAKYRSRIGEDSWMQRRYDAGLLP